jgi:hypothetical protein
VEATLLLVNGRIWQGINPSSAERPSAIAIRDGKISAVGDTASIRSSFRGFTEIDLGGRTVIPGLIDGHNHVVRGGTDWARGIDLSGCASREQFLATVKAAVDAAGPGGWVAGIGGWHPSMLGGWAPGPELLDEIAPENPVFLQAMYEFAVANRAAYALVPSVTADENGRVYGTPGYNAFVAAMPAPSLEAQVRGAAAMYRDFAAAGITGVHDPGGLGMTASSYDAVRELHRAGGLKCRLRLYYSAAQPGHESQDIAAWLRAGFGGPEEAPAGDDLLRAVGIGEVAHFGCHDFEGLDSSFEIRPDDIAGLEEITRAVAAAGLPMQVHGVLDSSITRILDCWERVDADLPVAGLRFALAHCDRISPVNIARMKRLGVGAIVDDRQAFRAGASLATWGDGTLDTVPPLAHIAAAGVPFGAGTDGTRASSSDPWRALHWLITGTAWGGVSQRDEQHLLSREQALHAYTHANTWFTSEEDSRGRLEPGYVADLAVLDRDYFTVSPDELLGTGSELTLAGGEVAYSSGAVADPA